MGISGTKQTVCLREISAQMRWYVSYPILPTHTHTHTHMHTHARTYTHTYMHTRKRTRKRTRERTHRHTHTHTHTQTYPPGDLSLLQPQACVPDVGLLSGTLLIPHSPTPPHHTHSLHYTTPRLTTKVGGF